MKFSAARSDLVPAAEPAPRPHEKLLISASPPSAVCQRASNDVRLLARKLPHGGVRGDDWPRRI